MVFLWWQESPTEPKIYYNFDLDEKVPNDHLLRRINEAVDFSFIYPMVKDYYSHTGAPSIDPVVVFKLSLSGYLYNVSSERRLLEEASLNMAYLWFIGYEIDEALPDHSILTKTRIRFGVDVYREFFHQIVRVCALSRSCRWGCRLCWFYPDRFCCIV